jgi:hypothetical protein
MYQIIGQVQYGLLTVLRETPKKEPLPADIL